MLTVYPSSHPNTDTIPGNTNKNKEIQGSLRKYHGEQGSIKLIKGKLNLSGFWVSVLELPHSVKLPKNSLRYVSRKGDVRAI